VDVDQIVKDASAIDVSPTERLNRAVPFRGTFFSALPLRNYLPYGRELLDNGLESPAVMAFERAAEANPGARPPFIVWARCSPEAGRRSAPAQPSRARSCCNQIFFTLPKPLWPVARRKLHVCEASSDDCRHF